MAVNLDPMSNEKLYPKGPSGGLMVPYAASLWPSRPFEEPDEGLVDGFSKIFQRIVVGPTRAELGPVHAAHLGTMGLVDCGMPWDTRPIGNWSRPY